MEPINIFDFDGTLTTDTWPKFWVWVKKFGYFGEKRNEVLEKALAEYRKTHTGNSLETFFAFFNDLLVLKKESITHSELMEGERYIEYNPGVRQYLEKSMVKNYVVSGGLKEFLENLEIAKYFKGIYGTSIQQNELGEMIGIGKAMTDDKKIVAIREIVRQNHRQEEDCRNVYFVGDVATDAADMRFVHNNGGKAIFVYQPKQEDALYHENQRIYERLKAEGMVDYCCVADYREGSELSNILQRIRQREEIGEER